GINVRRGNPKEQIPGENIIIPEGPELVKAQNVDLDDLKRSYCKNILKMNNMSKEQLTEADIQFIAEDTKSTKEHIKKLFVL
ncbi:MAG: PLP-dependent lyase/thiolase, partial [Aminobacterium sp.]|nr:PLP-dependent lyase/thiolase [Aminobacterium sp.]